MRDINKLYFTETHEWLSEDGTVGVTDHAQKEITDAVFVEMPQIGRTVKKGEACAVIESVKAAFDIYAPASGVIEAVNEGVKSEVAKINKDPYGEGWLFKLKISESAELKSLMDNNKYEEFLKK